MYIQYSVDDVFGFEIWTTTNTLKLNYKPLSMGLSNVKRVIDSNKNETEMIQRFESQRMGKNLLQFVSTKQMIINTLTDWKIQNQENIFENHISSVSFRLSVCEWQALNKCTMYNLSKSPHSYNYYYLFLTICAFD